MGIRSSEAKLSGLLNFYRTIFSLLEIKRKPFYLLTFVFLALAGLELIGFWLFAILFKSIHTTITNQSKIDPAFMVGTFSFESIQVLLFATIALVGRTWLSILLNRRLFHFFTKKLIMISSDNYSRFISSDLSLQNLIGHQRTYSLLSFGTNSLIYGTILSFFGLISDLLFAIFIVISMVILIDIGSILVIFIIIIASIVLIVRNRKQMSDVGYVSSISMERLGLVARESWGMRREIRLMSNVMYFLNRFTEIRKVSADSLYKLTIFGIELRAKMEIIGLLCILGATTLFIYSDNSESSFVSLGLIAIAVTRLTPIILRVQNTLINLLANKNYSMNLVQNMLDIKNTSRRKMRELQNGFTNAKEFELAKKRWEKKLLELKRVSFSHDSSRLVVCNVDLEVSRGEVLLINGRSGSGKSTLLDILAGLLTPLSGEIVSEDNLSCAYVPQEVSVFDGTILENLLLGREIEQEKRMQIEKLFKKDGLLSFVSDLKEGSSTIIGEKGRGLSGGQRQLIGLARATLFPIDLLILDEPTNSLDSTSLKKLENLILGLSRKGTCCVIATHDRKLNMIANRVVKMSKGKIVGIQSNVIKVSNTKSRK